MPRWLAGLTLVSCLYVSLTSADLRIASVPLKVPVVAITIAAWAVVHVRRRVRWPPSTVPVVLVGVVVPLVWFGLCELRIHAGDPAQREGAHYAVQQASRFLYLLLYLPLYAVLTDLGPERGSLPWRRGALALSALVAGLYVAHLLGVGFGRSGAVGPLNGVTTAASGLRIFPVNDILLLPATVIALGYVWVRGPTLGRALEVALLLLAIYLAHSRGIWIGLCLAIAVTVALSGAVHLPRPLRVPLAVAGAFVTLALLAISADPALGGPITRAIGATHELADAIRLQQAPQLLAGAREHLVVGSGLGATLPTGYIRSRLAPWSFELAYLQLLFQLGIVGLVMVASVPATALWRALRRLRVRGDERIELASATGALVGLLFADASNPYLMSSVGMLALAIAVATVDGLIVRSTRPSGRAA